MSMCHHIKVVQSFGFSRLVSTHAECNDVSMTASPLECLVGGRVVVPALKKTETEEGFKKACWKFALLRNV